MKAKANLVHAYFFRRSQTNFPTNCALQKGSDENYLKISTLVPWNFIEI